jgi:hypothetical protein
VLNDAMFWNGVGVEKSAEACSLTLARLETSKSIGTRSYRADSGFRCLYVPTLFSLDTFGLLAIGEKSCVVCGMTC